MTKDDPRLLAVAQALVHKFRNSLQGVRSCVISTEDGFCVAAHMQSPEAARLSAMASSMIALGVVAGDENQLGACASLVMEAEQGLIVMVQARRTELSLVLSVVANKDAVLGQVLYAAREAARQLEQL